MIITCPNCNKKFKIDDTKIPEKGRNLQCGSCNHIWFFKLDDKSTLPLTLNENLSHNEIDINITENEIKEPVKSSQSIKPNKIKEKEKKTIKISEKEKSLTKKIKKEKIDINYFSFFVVFIISFVALIILLDTLKTSLINIFPGLEIILINLYESLQDIKLFILDLF